MTAAVAIATAAVACGSASTPTSTPTAAAPLTVRLAHVPEGVVTLGVDATTRRLRVHLDAYGLAPQSPVTLLLRDGTCLAPGSGTAASFDAVTAAADGTVRTDVESRSALLRGRIPAGVSIELDAAGSVELACTDLGTAAATAPLRLFAPPRFKPAGTATLVRGPGDRLDVQVSTLDVRPGAPYTVELRNGSCQAQGTLVRRVVSLVGSAGGTADASVQLTGVGPVPLHAWYVVVLEGTVSSGSAPAGQPVLCGDVGS